MIYLAGHTGLAGSAILRSLTKLEYDNVVVRTHSDLDLLSQGDTYRFLENKRPKLVILAAARVGGIHANNTEPARFISENLIIQNNVINGSFRAEFATISPKPSAYTKAGLKNKKMILNKLRLIGTC